VFHYHRYFIFLDSEESGDESVLCVNMVKVQEQVARDGEAQNTPSAL